MSTIAELKASIEQAEHGCSCHLSPPCAFCVDMGEEEVSIYDGEGRSGVLAWRQAQLDEALDAETSTP